MEVTRIGFGRMSARRFGAVHALLAPVLFGLLLVAATSGTASASPTATPTRTATRTATASPTRTATRTPTPSATPLTGATLVGHLTWEGRAPQPSQQQVVSVTVTLNRLGSPYYSYNTTTDQNGFFTATLGTIPGGTYTWQAKGPQFLRTGGTVTLTSTITRMEMGLQPAGDVNNDNCAESVDFSILKAVFGLSLGNPGYDARADLNGSGTVNVDDFNLLLGRFGHCGTTPLTLQEEETMSLINQRRMAQGLSPLRVNLSLVSAARRHSYDIGPAGLCQHNGTDGSSPWDRAAQAGYTDFAMGEVVGCGYNSAQGVVQGWWNSPAHYDILTNSYANEIGCGWWIGPNGAGWQTCLTGHGE